MSRMVSTSVYLPDDQLKDLNKAARKLDVSRAMLIRKGIDMALAWADERAEILEKAEELVAANNGGRP